MKLLMKFNLIFAAVFGLGLVATGYTAREFLLKNAREQVEAQAKLMMQTAIATRTYTNKHIKPLLDPRQAKENQFWSASVPSFSAITVLKFLREDANVRDYKDYQYREASLNPTNPEDKTKDWEAQVIEYFKKNPGEETYSNNVPIVGPEGPSLYVARAMRVKEEKCLVCHSTTDRAPKAMLEEFKKLGWSNNGFNWHMGDVIAAQIVSVPMSVPVSKAEKAFFNLMVWLAAITVVSMVLMNIALIFAVIRPIRRMSAAADAISTGNLETEELEVNGKDEIAVLAGSFNRMHRSLVKAMKMLEG